MRRFALAWLLAAPACAQAVPPLSPIRELPADWRLAKTEWEQAAARIRAAWRDPGDPDARVVRGALDELDGLAAGVESQIAAWEGRVLALFRNRAVPGLTGGELETRARYVSDTRRLYLYGFLLPQSLNEGFEESGARAIPGYPLRLWVTPIRYCDDYSPLGAELGEIVERLETGAVRRSNRGSHPICDRSDWPDAWHRLGR